jgi:GNAT superfamily N-acetyltransferase
MSVQEEYKVTLEKQSEELGEMYDIVLGDMPIGYISQGGNTLVEIELHEDKRGRGYGKKAVQQWVERNRSDYRFLETTTVIDKRMEKIVKDIGFKMIGDTGQYILYVGE